MRDPAPRVSQLAFAFVAALALGLAAMSAQAAPGCLATPSVLYPGDGFNLVFTDFEPGETVTVTARRTLFDGGGDAPYAAQASYRAGAAGQVAPALDAPLERGPGGAAVYNAYSGADPLGLLWSMTRVGGPAVMPRDRLRFEAQAGSRSTACELRLAPPPERREIPVGAPLPGAFLSLPTALRRPPVVIAVGGSEGGDAFARGLADRLGPRGYAVLVLPYLAPPWLNRRDLAGLPAAFVELPLERLQAAHDWLRTRDEVDASRVAVYGVSKGAEFALIAATRFSWIGAVVAVAASDVVWEGFGLPGQVAGRHSSFSWRGAPLPFVPYDGFEAETAGYAQGRPVHLLRPHVNGRARHPQRVAPARIPVETIGVPLLVAGGMDDRLWPSGAMTLSIVERRAAAGRPTVGLVFPDAGHALSGDGWGPTTGYDSGAGKVGGSPQGNAQAQRIVAQAAFDLLARALSPTLPPPPSAPEAATAAPAGPAASWVPAR